MPPVVAYANRLPVSKSRAGWHASAGGLVSALRPALEERGGSWVGWDGGADDVPKRLDGLGIDLCPVRLSRKEVDDYYHGFANRTLWPLLHGLVEQPVLERAWWRAYREVNARFAAVSPEAAGALNWVHDYQLMLVPALLRERAPEQRTVFFLHIPFPAPELYARLPWRAQLLDGLLGADVVAFHTEEYRDNFARACARLRDDVRVDDARIVLPDGREVVTAAHPISIDAASYAAQAVEPGVERCLRGLRKQFGGKRVLVGVDRLDYTKGILERLRAIELVLERRPDLRGSVAFVQIAVPSRGEIREYRELRTSVEELVGRINGRFTEPLGDVPVHYLYRGITPDRLLAYYRVADVGLVTPLRDGMNLVAKEFVTSQHAGASDGALVLSEFTGAAEQLHGAILCNPFDVEGVAGAIELALELPAEDRRARLDRMAAEVAEHDVHWWAEQELSAA